MTAREWLDELADLRGLELVTVDGFDAEIMGVAQSFDRTVVVYDLALMLEQLEAQGMTPEEAREYFEFNIVGAYVGDASPAFLEFAPDLLEGDDDVH